jgi:hypothetical protein
MYGAFLVVLLVALMVTASAFELQNEPHLKPRTKAPTFKAKAVLNDKFMNLALDDYINAKKWSVLLFYPFDYTFVCPVCSALRLPRFLL